MLGNELVQYFINTFIATTVIVLQCFLYVYAFKMASFVTLLQSCFPQFLLRI